MRITLIIYSLGAGGAERVLSIMANYWAARGWTINLLTLVDSRESAFYELHPAVAVRALGIDRVSTNPAQAVLNNLTRLLALRRAIKTTAPDAVISFMDRTNVLVLAAMLGTKTPIVVAERNDPGQRSIGKSWTLLRRRLYPRAAQIVTQTENARQYFAPNVRRRSRVIPNPMRPVPATGSTQDRQKVVIAVGRLEKQKGFDLLLQAFAGIATQHPQWSLEIWGEGTLRAALETQTRALNLENRVRLPGRTQRLFEQMQQSQIFVLSSRYEGFPNVLGEAMACGLAAVSFDCPSGPREIIRDGVDGVLVPPNDVAALAAALSALMNDEPRRVELAARAPEVVARFSEDKVMALWETVVREVIA